MTMGIFKGKTEDAEAPFLGAEFWKPGTKVVGAVKRTFKSQFGESYVLSLVTPVEVAGESLDEVSIGNMAGMVMALQAANLARLIVGDHVVLECTGTKPPKKEGYSPRINFEIEITRSAKAGKDEPPWPTEK